MDELPDIKKVPAAVGKRNRELETDSTCTHLSYDKRNAGSQGGVWHHEVELISLKNGIGILLH